MARTQILMRLPGSKEPRLFRTNLKGHGSVREGEEFTAREMWGWGKPVLMEGGKRLLVRVTAVERLARNHHIVNVEILTDLTAKPNKQGKLF